MAIDIETVPVAIIGAGPVGLAMGLDLAWHGQRSVIFEKDAGTALILLAKAGGLYERSLEFCRRWGIADRVANCGVPDDHTFDTVYCTSLTGHLIGRDPLPSTRERRFRGRPWSPEIIRKCPQYLFDPILAKACLETGLVDIRYGTRVEQFEQDEVGVTLTYTATGGGSAKQLRAAYLLGCDGATSQVREALGIAFEGQTLDYSLSIAARIRNLEKYHRFGRSQRFLFVTPNGTWANLTSMDYMELWRLTVLGSEERQNIAARDPGAELRRAFGRDDIPFEIVRAMPWRRSQCTASTYRKGRVLLAGDAAHTTSPTGGFGLNTSLGDVFGLGWMLDAMLRGWGGPHLLDAYEIERRPVIVRNSSQSTRNYQNWLSGSPDFSRVELDGPEGDAAREKLYEFFSRSLYPEWHSYGLAMGYHYDDSPVIVPDFSPPPVEDVSYYVQTSRPGHRAPHAWLPDGRSTLDLFGRGFVLMRMGMQPQAASTLVDAAARRGVPLQVVDLPIPEVAGLYDVNLALVRPDGHVAWRGEELPRDVDRLIDIVRGAVAPSPAERRLR